MSGISADEMASKIVADGFPRQGRPAAEASDPIVDTPMLVTLDQLQPYDRNPRVRKNPLYDEICASIRERGLDTPPAITRRPGESKYVIRNGGNTRLSILRELWSETRDERYFRIHCLFRPWTVRGEITILTGHLAENELHGRLSFIERALGVERARELYEQESQSSLSQSELARRLTADGFPVQQSHISRMRDAIQFLLPAIPSVLYGGLGRHQVERLAVLRRAGERGWELFAGEQSKDAFSELFHDVLSLFDGSAEQFSLQRFQDELLGRMADQLQMDYARLTLEIHELEGRQRALNSDPSPSRTRRQVEVEAIERPLKQPDAPRTKVEATTQPASSTPDMSPTTAGDDSPASPRTPDKQETVDPDIAAVECGIERMQGHIASAAATTERLKSIQKLVSDQLDEDKPPPDFEHRVLQAIPVQAGGLYPISDVWYIEPSLDTPEHLRIHIAQLAREIAEEHHEAECIQPIATGLGYACTPSVRSVDDTEALQASIVTVLQLLVSNSKASAPTTPDLMVHRAPSLGTLLISASPQRISDTALVQMFRLIRLARRLSDLVAAAG